MGNLVWWEYWSFRSYRKVITWSNSLWHGGCHFRIWCRDLVGVTNWEVGLRGRSYRYSELHSWPLGLLKRRSCFPNFHSLSQVASPLHPECNLCRKNLFLGQPDRHPRKVLRLIYSLLVSHSLTQTWSQVHLMMVLAITLQTHPQEWQVGYWWFLAGLVF